MFARGAHWSSTTHEQKQSLLAVFALLSMFVVARCYSYWADGPPQIPFAYTIWSLEAVGATTALVLFYLHDKHKAN
jgi:hypothetical protein